MARFDVAEHFRELLRGERNLKSTGVAAIETLMRCIEASEVKDAINVLQRVLTHSFSKVVLQVLSDAKKDGVNAHVFVTESRPDESGNTMISKLKDAGIQCTLILDSAVGYLMETVDMVVVGAEGVMETGGIINKIGTLPMVVCAKAMHKPVFVMAESIKFVKEYPLTQSDIPTQFKYHASTLKKHMVDGDYSEEHPLVDYTPPQYINLLFTELGILTPAAVGDKLLKLYI